MINDGAINNSATINFVLNKNMITNCLTHIPQDIKLELNDGTLTLKAGSKVYVPNGFEADGTTPKFDVVVVESDLTSGFKSGGGAKFLIYYNQTLKRIDIREVYSSFSGATAPTGDYRYWYNTTNNIIKKRELESDSWENQFSFPVCIATNTTSGWTSIDKFFNGFGEIGLTTFALPGVKGLIPNGINEDGSLKNIEFTLNKVVTGFVSYNISNAILGLNSSMIGSGGYYYDFVDNFVRNSLDNNTTRELCIFASFSSDDSRITSFNTKTTFHALDYNDKDTILNWGAPNYSAGISVSSGYNAPTDGVITVRASGNNRTSNVSINGVQIFSSNWDASYGTPDNAEYRIGAGQKITLAGVSCTFYPLLGA